MKEEVKIRFYSIEKCGYYKHGEKEPEFGELSDVLSELFMWITERQINFIDSCTYSIGEEDNDLLRTFCFDIKYHEKTKDFFITTWNEVPSHDGKISSVYAFDRVGEANVFENDIEENTIPGYATYFWFVSDLNMLLSVRVKNSLYGLDNFKKYIKGFMESYSKHAVILQLDDNNAEKQGYRKEESSEILKLYPLFKINLIRKKFELNLLRDKRKNIRKIIRRNRLNLAINMDKNLFDNVLISLGIKKEVYDNNNIDIKYNLNYTPSEEELNSIIDQASSEKLSNENDYGFVFSGDDDVHWLGRSIVKDDIDIDIKMNNEVVDLESLMNCLLEKRDRIVRLISEIQ
ncbi:MAG: hypothetical protein D3922_01920 [Candidatus Electrothrix sp. AR1]|nr:hypothetical protein [Candidatus Electrothrix sp. AR1]